MILRFFYNAKSSVYQIYFCHVMFHVRINTEWAIFVISLCS